jgi:hypothetical protein
MEKQFVVTLTEAQINLLLDAGIPMEGIQPLLQWSASSSLDAIVEGIQDEMENN